MKKLLVFLVALLSVAMFANPTLTVSGSASFELVFDENGFDLVAGPAGSGTWGADGAFETATDDGTWTAAWAWDGSDVTVSSVAFENDVLSLELADNSLTVSPAAVAGLSVTLSDLGAKDYVDKDDPNKDAKMTFADYKLAANYVVPVANFGLDSVFSNVTVGGYYGVKYFAKAGSVKYYDAGNKLWPYSFDEAKNESETTYAATNNGTLKLYDMKEVLEFKAVTPKNANYVAPFYGFDASLGLAAVPGLSASLHFGMANDGKGFVTTTATTTIDATYSTYTKLHDVAKYSTTPDSTPATYGTLALVTNVTAPTKVELDKEYVVTVSYSNAFDLSEMLSLTPHVTFLNKVNQEAADEVEQDGSTAAMVALFNQKATKATSSDATQVEAGLDVTMTVAGLALNVSDTYYYSLEKDDTQFAKVAASASYSLDMVDLSAALDSYLTMEKDKDLDYFANLNVGATVVPIEAVTVAANVYYDLDKDDSNNDNALGYELSADYAWSVFNMGVVAGTYNGDFSANDEDMHWYGYVKASVSF